MIYGLPNITHLIISGACVIRTCIVRHSLKLAKLAYLGRDWGMTAAYVAAIPSSHSHLSRCGKGPWPSLSTFV